MFKIFNGDCLDIMPKEIGDKSVDLILCDLPYGTTDNEWDIILPFDELWREYNRIIKDNGAIVLFSQMPFGAYLINSNKKNFRYEWIWEKEGVTGFLNAKKCPLKKHENILVFYKQLPTYNPQGLRLLDKPLHRKKREKSCPNYKMTKERAYTQTHTNYPTDILQFSRDKGLHPTQKPVKLLEYLIKTYTHEGELVLDNCMGSGSTGEACLNTSRRFIGIEKDEIFFKVAKERLNREKQIGA